MSKRICKICGRSYEYCPTCYKDSFKPRWMISFDDEPCKKLWDICCAHGAGQITSKEALSQLEDINYRELMVENKEILAHIAKIEKDAMKSDDASAMEAVEIVEPTEDPKEEVKPEKPVETKKPKSLSLEEDAVTLAINRAKDVMRRQI